MEIKNVAILLFQFLHDVADIHNPSGEALNPHDDEYVGLVEHYAEMIVGHSHKSLGKQKKR